MASDILALIDGWDKAKASVAAYEIGGAFSFVCFHSGNLDYPSVSD